MQKFRESGDSRYIYQSDLGEVCFQLDMAYNAYKVLTRRTVSDKVLHNKAFAIATNSKDNGYQRGLNTVVCWQITQRYYSPIT